MTDRRASTAAGAAIAAAPLAGCATADAIQQLPEGYWVATWSLVEALFTDVLNLLALVF